MAYNETVQHGTGTFPFGLYTLNSLSPKYVMAYHWHTEIEIIRVISGTLSVNLDNREFSVDKDSVVFVNSEVIHGATPNNAEYECLVFNLEFIKTDDKIVSDFIENILSHHVFVNEVINDPYIVSSVKSLFDTVREKKEGFNFKTLGFISLILGEIIEKNYFLDQQKYLSSHNEKSLLILKNTLKYVRTNYSKDLSLKEIADSVDLSEKYFCRFFKELTGQSPITYLITYRVERAARLLIATDIPITQISLDCGFNDLSYFIKTFKNIKKVTPSKYRKLLKI